MSFDFLTFHSTLFTFHLTLFTPHSTLLTPQTSRLWWKNSQHMPETPIESMIARTNPQGSASIPLMRFIPNIEVISVGIIIMIVTEVSVRITVFILLLMILE